MSLHYLHKERFKEYGQEHPHTQHSPVVLLHGLFGSLENLNATAKSLQSVCDVIAIDLPNHGRSKHVDTVSYVQMSEAVSELMAGLDIKKFSIVGHSMGGKVAMQLALNNPLRIDKLVIADIAPVAYPSKHNEVLEALKALDLSSVNNRKEADVLLQPVIPELGVRNFVLKSLIKTDNTMAWRFNLQGIVDNYANLNLAPIGDSVYQGPALFIKGENSDYIKTEHRPAIVQLFPNSKAHVIGGAGHWLHAQKPEQFNRIVRRFLFG
jgi:esterase